MALASILDFRSMFPEFGDTGADLLAEHLANAATHVPEDTWQHRQREGHAYLAAHLLAISPYGQNARLASAEGESTYGRRYEALRIEVAASWGR